MTNDLKIEIATTAAKIVSAMYKRVPHHLRLPFNALVDEGFLHITSEIKRQAHSQAYYWILQMCHKQYNPRARQMVIDRTRVADNYHVEPDLDAIMDVREALMKLSHEERELLFLVYSQDMKLRQIAKIMGLSNRSSVCYHLTKIKHKLEVELEAYR